MKGFVVQLQGTPHRRYHILQLKAGRIGVIPDKLRQFLDFAGEQAGQEYQEILQLQAREEAIAKFIAGEQSWLTWLQQPEDLSDFRMIGLSLETWLSRASNQ
jgi:hypothetical protein